MRLHSYLLLGSLLLLLVPGVGAATPIQYGTIDGDVTLFATSGGAVLADPVTVPLEGVQITVDDMANQLVSLALSAQTPIVLDLQTPYGAFDTITIESLVLTGGRGSLTPVAGNEFFFSLPFQLALVISADGPGAIPIVSQPFDVATIGTGSIFVGNGDISFDSIDIANIGPFGGADAPITLKADFVLTAVPEPSTVALFGLGLAILGVRRRQA